MIDKINLEQNTGANSENLLAGRDIVINKGISYEDIKLIVMDTIKNNFQQLSNDAKNIARARAEEITEQVLKSLYDKNPDGLLSASDPDFQFSLYEVQKEYARCGDKDLGNLLVDLLVDRSKYTHRDILQIVLNEALQTVPKLTNYHLAHLATIFILRYTNNHDLINHEALGSYFDQYVLPFVNELKESSRESQACYQHLTFAGCGIVSMGEVTLDKIFGQNYQGLFSRGFGKEKITEIGISPEITSFFMPCLNDSSKFQVKVLNSGILEELFNNQKTLPDYRNKITALFNQNTQNAAEIKEKCILIRPYMEKIFSVWSNTQTKNFELTSIGIAIGHAVVQRNVGKFAELSIWIN